MDQVVATSELELKAGFLPAPELPTGLRWCLSTLGCPTLDLAAAAALAARFGVPELELRALANRLDLPAWFRETFSTPAAFARHASATGIRITVLDTSLKLVGSTPADRAAFLDFIPWAEALGVPWLRVFDGGHPSATPHPSTLREAAETVRWWQTLRHQNHWRTDIVMETHDAFCHASTCLALQQHLSTPCLILWDAHHTYHKAAEPIATTWDALRPFVRHIHFKDSLPIPNPINDYTLALPGTGCFPIAQLLSLLQRDAYDGALCFEWERQWQPWADPLEDALAALTQLLATPPSYA